ncbi:MAG: TIGR01777 family protein [Planctomycetota bacterium]|nr:MAG: TIGR01777 family protein [Planctomycetota bacterium]
MMRILVSGATGLIGTEICRRARDRDWSVYTLSRRRAPDDPHRIVWNPEEGTIEADALPALDAVVHLAGESVAGRWTAAKKARIRRSRVEGTRLLVDALGRSAHKPRVFFSASAVGYYGRRGDELVDENEPPGDSFLAQTCAAWEQEARRASDQAERVVIGRVGIVLASHGGALAQMLPVFRRGLGGHLGTGLQYMSWITLNDVVEAILFLLETPDASGTFNLTAPNPVTNREFTRELAAALRRPAWLPAPSLALRLVLGEMAEELLLNGVRAVPTRLQERGFTFLHERLPEGLQWALSTKPPSH